MDVNSMLAPGNQRSFLPTEMLGEDPDYLVWWTGTLGHAEWLITHSTMLHGRAAPVKCDVDLGNLPLSLRPLMSLEQPDLLVSTADLKPLVSVEITEQAQFGSNIEQRMARFWSAAASRVPAAYIAPIEGYQIEQCSTAEEKRFEEPRDPDWTISRFVDSVPQLRLSHIKKWQVGSVEELIHNIIESNDEQLDEVKSYLRRFHLPQGSVRHVEPVPPEERLHRIGGRTYKAYLRSAQTSGSMVLSWFERCNSEVPAAVFKLQSELSHLYETNGIVHLTRDDDNPHLSFRNLPVGPGQGPIVHQRSNTDEISLFFRFIDAAISGHRPAGLCREEFTSPGEYFDSKELENWWRPATTRSELEARKSGDFKVNASLIHELIESSDSSDSFIDARFINEREYFVLKISSSANRSLGDPYSGKLALRDFLFCRDGSKGEYRNMQLFRRRYGLVFLVDFHGVAAERHPFVNRDIERMCKKLGVPLGESVQQSLVNMLLVCRAEQISKQLRSHVIFSDLIIVRRNLPTGTTTELVAGLPALLRSGAVSSRAACVESLVA